jgi:hypothetical protein
MSLAAVSITSAHSCLITFLFVSFVPFVVLICSLCALAPLRENFLREVRRQNSVEVVIDLVACAGYQRAAYTGGRIVGDELYGAVHEQKLHAARMIAAESTVAVRRSVLG